MSKIATESEALNIGGNAVVINQNRMCTKSRAEAIGCEVKGSYDANQLVQLSDLEKAVINIGSAVISLNSFGRDSSSNGMWYQANLSKGFSCGVTVYLELTDPDVGTHVSNASFIFGANSTSYRKTISLQPRWYPSSLKITGHSVTWPSGYTGTITTSTATVWTS